MIKKGIIEMEKFVLIKNPVNLLPSIEGVFSSYEECDRAMDDQMNQFKEKIHSLIDALPNIHKDYDIGWIEAVKYTEIPVAQTPICF